MQRRALLTTMAVGAGGLAGCLGSSVLGSTEADDAESGTGNENGSAGDETDPSGGETDPSDGDPPADEPPDRYASIVDFETIDRTYALSPTTFRTDDDGEVALWFDRTATAEAPARLTGWLENDNDHEHTFEIEWIPAVGRTHSRTLTGYDHTSRLLLAPTEHNELAETVPELTRNEDGLWQAVGGGGAWMPDEVRLDPGERVQLAYAVVGKPDMPGRPTGTYEFNGRDRSVEITVWETDSPGPEGESRFAGREVPPLRNRSENVEEENVLWYHDADESTPAYLEPARETLELDGAIDFELVYNARQSTGCGHWNVYKLVDGEWFHVDPLVHTADCRSIAPGARMDWTLRAFNGPAVACSCDGGCGRGLTRGYLGPGIYGVVAGYGHPALKSGALVELEGEPVTIEPTDDATIERDGAEVVVTTDSYGDGEHPPDATLFAERAGDDGGSDGDDGDDSGSDDGDGDGSDGDGGEEPDRIIPEQLMGSQPLVGRSGALQNAIAVFDDDVERVEVRSDEYDVEKAADRAETRRVEVRGTVYELTAEFAEEA